MIGRRERPVRGRVARRLALLAMMCCMLALDVYSGRGLAAGGWPYVVVGVVYAAACLSVALRPVTGSVVVILTATLCIAVPSFNSSHMVFGVAAAFGIVFLLAPMWMAAGLFAVNAAVNLLAPASMGIGMGVAVSVLIVQCVSVSVGYGIRRYRAYGERQRDLLRIRMLSERNEILERDMLVARRLHDILTNDLTYVITVANTRMLDADGVERETLERIDGKTREALDCAHAVIDQLRMDGPDAHGPAPHAGGRARKETGDIEAAELSEPHEPRTSGSGSLSEFVEARRNELAALGFEGTAGVTGDGALDRYDSDVREEVRSLLAELFANIRRHCVPGDDYSLMVDIDERRIRIVQMNTVTLGSRQRGQKISSGRGLATHRDIIRRLNGTMRTTLEDNTWTIRVRLPYERP